MTQPNKNSKPGVMQLPEDLKLVMDTFRSFFANGAPYMHSRGGSYFPACRHRNDSDQCSQYPGRFCKDCPDRDVPDTMTDDHIHLHFRGKLHLGASGCNRNSTSTWIAFDFDGKKIGAINPNPLADSLALKQAATGVGLPAYIVSSASGGGYHVYIFMSAPVNAAAARGTALKLEQLCGWLDAKGNKTPAKITSTLDVTYPNETAVAPDAFGKIIRLPWFPPAVEQHGFSLFVDDTGKPINGQWAYLTETVQRADIELVRQLGDSYYADTKTSPVTTADLSTSQVQQAFQGADLDAKYGPVNYELLKQRCAFIRGLEQDPENIDYEQWFTRMTILKACGAEGARLVHELSKDHPKYDEKTTNDKFNSISKGPRGCIYIREHHSDKCPGVVCDWWSSANPALVGRERYQQPSAMPSGGLNWLKENKRNMADLVEREDIPPPREIIKGLLFMNTVNLLAAPPKRGKSVLALNIVKSLATGGEVLGRENLVGEKLKCLYLELEGTEQLLQQRVKAMMNGHGVGSAEGLAGFDYYMNWPRMSVEAGGLALLEQALVDGDYDVVVIDTLAKVREIGSGKTRMTEYMIDYKAISDLAEMAHAMDVTMFIVHHTRKAGGSGVVDMVSGTYGVSAGADNIYVMHREDGGDRDKCQLLMEGRMLQAEDKTLCYDRDTWTWTIEGSAALLEMNAIQEKIYSVMKAKSGSGYITTQEIMDWLDGDIEKNRLSDNLGRLVELELIKKGPKRGMYAVVDELQEADIPV